MATRKFEVGDTVRINDGWGNGNGARTGTEGKVKLVNDAGRYAWYTVVAPDRYGSGNIEYRFTGSYLDLVKKGNLPPVVHPVYKTDEANALAAKCVATARKAAKKHNLCSVVEDVLIEAGLGAYLNTTKTVKVVTEVTVSSKPGESLTDEQATAKALAAVKSGTAEFKTSVTS